MRFELQVMMMKSKKIVLFIVEGITDQTCLGYIMSELLIDESVHFYLTNGDITSKYGSTPSNIKAGIGNLVKQFSGDIFKANDFSEVIHLIDTDGAFIPDDRIISSSVGGTHYEENDIATNRVDTIQKRNHQKTAILDQLIHMNTVWKTIPYHAYFFSCNLDHVLHGNSNLDRIEKNALANEFEKKYVHSPEEFVAFISDDRFTVPGDFKGSWKFIKDDTNSLKRYSNFHLFFKEG